MKRPFFRDAVFFLATLVDDRYILNELGVGCRMQDPPISDDES